MAQIYGHPPLDEGGAGLFVYTVDAQNSDRVYSALLEWLRTNDAFPTPRAIRAQLTAGAVQHERPVAQESEHG